MRSTRFLLSLGTVLLFCLLTTAPGQAQTVIHVDADKSAPGDGTSWGSAYPALQDAFDKTNANPSTDYEIWIAEGTYYPDLDNVDNDGDGSEEHTADSDTSFTLTRDGVEVYGGFSGGETSRSSRDPDANVVTLSGDIEGDDDVLRPNTDSDNDSSTPNQTDHINGTNATHVVLLDGRGSENITSETILDGVTVISGKADGNGLDKYGGGIFCRGILDGNECSPSLTDVIVQGNHGVTGGGMYNRGTFGGTSSPTVTNSVFRWNVAEGRGGAMHNNGGNNEDGGTSSPSIDGGKFVNNYSSTDAGAISFRVVDGTASPSLTGVRFEDNSAERFGGTIGIISVSGGSATPQITNCEFVENGKRNAESSGEGSRGGAIDIFAFRVDDDGNSALAEPIIEQTTFSNNTAYTGGAIFIRALRGGITRTSISGSDFSQNDAYRAGAIQVEGDSVSDGGRTAVAELSLSSSTFTSNTADKQGGGLVILANEGGEARPEISDVSFSSNQAGQGGAVDVFANDTDDNGNPAVASPTFTGVEFLGNTATGLSESSGGAFLASTQNGGTVTPSVVNSIFSGNTADIDGGAVDVETQTNEGSPVAEPTFTNVTFTGNEANESGGAVSVRREASNGSSNPTFTNTILWNNTSDADGNGSGSEDEIYLSDASASASYSIIDGGCPTGVNCGTNLLDENPQFAGSNKGAGSDGTFGTSDDDLRLQGPGSGGGASPAIDAGDNTAISENNDLGGNNRNFDVEEVTNTGNTPNGGPPVDFGPHESVGDPLPVELVAFEGQLEGKTALLSWETASEQNNAGFAVQRKSSSEEWKRLGFVETKATGGTTSEPQSYRFRDSDIPFASDSLVYRLKQIDTDGTAHYSDPTVLRRAPGQEVKLLAPAPNPVRTQTQVRFSLPEDTGSEVQLKLYDVMGRELRTIRIPAEEGRHKRKLDVQNLTSGIYFLHLEAEGQVKTRKVTVVR